MKPNWVITTPSKYVDIQSEVFVRVIDAEKPILTPFVTDAERITFLEVVMLWLAFQFVPTPETDKTRFRKLTPEELEMVNWSDKFK